VEISGNRYSFFEKSDIRAQDMGVVLKSYEC